GGHAQQAQWLAVGCEFENAVKLKPTPATVLLPDAAHQVEVFSRPQRGLKRRLERGNIVGVQVSLDELSSGQNAVGARMTENLVHAVVDPDGLVGPDVPFKHAERRAIGGNAQAGFAFA